MKATHLSRSGGKYATVCSGGNYRVSSSPPRLPVFLQLLGYLCAHPSGNKAYDADNNGLGTLNAKGHADDSTGGDDTDDAQSEEALPVVVFQPFEFGPVSSRKLIVVELLVLHVQCPILGAAVNRDSMHGYEDTFA